MTKNPGSPVTSGSSYGPASSISTTLLQLVKARDQAGWQRFVAVYGPMVYAWCRRWEVPAEDAPDVVQEVFRAVWQNVARFRRSQPGDTLAQYSWVGLGTMVIEDFQQPDVKLDYFGGTSGSYAGFDRFDRVIDQKWYDYGASAVRDRYAYGYDRASNRLYRENTGPSGKDELYGYDGMYQLYLFYRGDLNAGKTGLESAEAWGESFWFDPTGNWTLYSQSTLGDTLLFQPRTQNKANETTEISTLGIGLDWADPVHDKAGNMTTVPKPSSLANGLTLKYDGWNRLVEVKDGQTVVGKYEFDGLNRRVKKQTDSQSPASPNGIDRYEHLFYNSAWQILETRDTTTENDQPEGLQPDYQYVWSARYIDAPVLRDKNSDTDGLCDDQRLYFLTDANFNVTTLTDTGGDAVERYLYNPYGKVTIYDGTWTNTRSSSSYDNTILYTGREYDPETGLYHYRNRPYHAELGRFPSRDAIDPDDRGNLYGYVLGSPVNLTDPYGLLPVTIKKCTPQEFDRCCALCKRKYAGQSVRPTCTVLRYDIFGIIHERVYCNCNPTGCKQCVPPLGTIGYRVDQVPPSRPHLPHPGTHTHLAEMHQSPYPQCRCFWKMDYVPPVAGSTPPPGTVPITPAGGGGKLY